MTVHALALTVQLRLPTCDSLKVKRATLAPVVEGARRRFAVAAAATDHQDSWQRAELGFVAVSGEAGQTAQVIDAVERFVWSFPEVEVLEQRRDWLEVES